MGMLKRDHIKAMCSMQRIAGLWEAKYGRIPDEKDIDNLYSRFEKKMAEILHNYATPKPYTVETVAALRESGMKIGSTTGYTDAMMEIIVPIAAELGYSPDCWFSPDSTGGYGRPYPYMIFRNLETLHVSSVENVIKVGDTVSDILEGKNAGVTTVGILEGSSEMALTQKEYEALSQSERRQADCKVEKIYLDAGADFVIRDLGELPELLQKLNATTDF